MAYIDVFVAPVSVDKKDAYRAHAEKMDKLFIAAGALTVTECWASDVPEGKLTSFPMAVKLEPGEVVATGWIKWPSKQARDAAWEELMKHPDMQPEAAPMPFDGKRMIFGGFDVLFEM
jgi:uncharacterized protein YbaA (DUF1428 family)